MLRRVALMAVIASASVSLSCDRRQARAPNNRHPVPETVGSQVAATASTLSRLQRLEWRRSDPARWLLAQVRQGDAVVRARAALAIGRMAHPHGLEPLVDALSDSAAPVRQNAAFALRLHVLDGLGGRAPGAVLRALRRALARERSPIVRRTLIVSLGWIGEPSDADLISGYLDRAPKATLLALGLVAARRERSGRRAKHLGARKPDTRPLRILPFLRGTDPHARRLAAWVLSRMVPRWRFPSAVRAALRQAVVAGADPALRALALRALGPPTTQRSIRLCSGRLSDRDSRVRSEAALALSRGSRAAAVRLARDLVRLWRGISSNQRRLVGPEVGSVLVGLGGLERHARIPSVRHAAGRMLELSDASDAAVPYKPLEQHSIDLVNCTAARVWDLGQRLPERTPTCGTARSPQLSIAWRRAQVPTVLGRMQRDARWRLTMLRRYLHDAASRVRIAATQALAEIDDDAIAIPVSRALEDPSPSVFAAAATVVARRPRRLAGGRAVKALVGRLHSLSPATEPEAICAGIAGARGLGLNEALPTIRELMRGSAWMVRTCATAAWEAMTGQRADPVDRPSRGLPDVGWSGRAPLPRRAVLVTLRGEIALELYASEAPAAVALLARMIADGDLARARVDRALLNHVVEFRIDPMGDAVKRSPHQIPCELTERPFVRGSVGMRISGRDTARGDLFISLLRQPERDGRYTQVARVVRGMEIVEQLLPGDPIKAAEVDG